MFLPLISVFLTLKTLRSSCQGWICPTHFVHQRSLSMMHFFCAIFDVSSIIPLVHLSTFIVSSPLRRPLWTFCTDCAFAASSTRQQELNVFSSTTCGDRFSCGRRAQLCHSTTTNKNSFHDNGPFGRSSSYVWSALKYQLQNQPSLVPLLLHCLETSLPLLKLA